MSITDCYSNAKLKIADGSQAGTLYGIADGNVGVDTQRSYYVQQNAGVSTGDGTES